MKQSPYIILCALAAVATSSCDRGSDSWTLEGEMPAATGAIYVEAPTAGGQWYAIDSVTSPGKFKLELTRPSHSTIMRVRTSASTAYFPVDSTEHLTFDSNNFSVIGTEGADLFAKVDQIVRSNYKPDMDASADSLMKRELLSTLSGNYASHAAYYLVKKEIDGHRLLNPEANDQDYKILRAVTNAFNGLNPEDPRTRSLVTEYMRIEAQRRAGDQPVSDAQTPVIYAPEIGYFDIALINAQGKEMKLSDVVDTNKVVVLNFMDFSDQNVGILNAAIGTAYNAFHDNGLEVYQVGFDSNAHLWSNVARNLPWTAVYQSETAPSAHLGQYGINSLPTTFIIANGEISKRVDDLNELTKELKPFF